MKKYLKGWYNTDCEVFEAHKSFEAGAAVKILGIDDSGLKDIPYYPYDLVHYKESQMRDTVQSEEYFRERFNKDSEKLKRQLQDYHNDIEIGPHPEKFDIRSYKHFLYIDAFLKFNSGYSLGLDMQELLPEVHIMVRNLIDTRKMRDVGYAYMENILYFIILFNLSEYLDEYQELLKKSTMRDFYLDSLMQTLDSSWQISTEKLCCPKYSNAVYEVVLLSKENKAAAVERLKRYLKRQWIHTMTEGLITKYDLKRGDYRGYWCIASAALVKALGLDDTELHDCKYYPRDMAHFC